MIKISTYVTLSLFGHWDYSAIQKGEHTSELDYLSKKQDDTFQVRTIHPLDPGSHALKLV